MEWDVAIIGAGMGGAAFGHAIASAGYRVLFIEKGLSEFSESRGDDPEDADPDRRLRHGRWPSQIVGCVDGKEMSFYPPLGCGAGGSTLLYAGTLERLAREDFVAAQDQIRSAWPFGYEELEPHYAEAEQLFRVRGTPDPFYVGEPALLRTPAPMSASDRELFSLLKENGLQPYQSHNACEVAPGCLSCGGVICHRGCKHDARRVFLEPLLRTGRAAIFDRCTVDRIDANHDVVTELICRRNGEELVVKARYYALAAGALSTPMLLLGSANRFWPNGIANSSDMVGRNLMFHVSDFLAVWPRARGQSITAERAIAVRDFYKDAGEDLGMIQSTGMAANARNIMHVLTRMFDTGFLRRLRPLRRLASGPAFLAALVLGRATIFATILEDHPYRRNRVVPHSGHPGKIYFEYTISEELRERLHRFRKLYRQAFRRRRMWLLTPDVNLNFGHACGTCTAGADPNTSVVDRNNRAHDLKNLYIIDASTFPTSGGVNPSLTVAANGLRVGSILAATLLAAKAAVEAAE